MKYYIADTHFGDERVMRLAGRPFQSVEHMDAVLVEKWNARVDEDDQVYVLGDFAFSDEIACKILPMLKGEIHLICGNHDIVLSNALHLFKSTDAIKQIYDNGRSTVLCHYPLLSYENSIYGGYQVFGHIHNNPHDVASELQKYLVRSLHAGVDVVDFEPKTLDELIAIKNREYVAK